MEGFHLITSENIMIELIKTDLKVGDSVKLLLTTGKEPQGIIKEFHETSLVLETEANSHVRIFLNMIGGWEVKKEKLANENPKENLSTDSVETIVESVNENQLKSKYTDRPLGLTILGTIDLDEKDKPKVTVPEKTPEPLPDISGSFASFKDLKSAVDKFVIDKVVSPNGYIVKHSSMRGFGFLHDKDSNEIYFNYNDVIDDRLLKMLDGTKQHLQIHISFTVVYSGERRKAFSLHQPWTVKQILEKAEEFIGAKDLMNARNLCEQILEVFPNNSDAENLLEKIDASNRSQYSTFRNSGLNYFRAKKAKEAKNYEEAIKYFLLALDGGEKIESTVKDLATTYQEMGEIEKGVELLEKYMDKLPANSATYNFTANYYAAAGLIETALLYLKRLDEITPKYKKPDLLYRKASFYIKVENYSDALECIKQILRDDKANPIAQKLEEKLVNAIETGIYEKSDDFLIGGTEFAHFTGGLPQILVDTLDNSDYAGLPASVKSPDKISENHLKQIRNLIEEAGKARPRERTRYLLTEAKLVQLLHPENEEELRKTLSRYCTAMAISFEVENYNPDIIRFYHLLSFELERSWRINANQVSLYLMSFSNSLNKIRTRGIDVILKQLKFTDHVWDGLIELMISNSEISSMIVEKLFNDGKKKQESLEYAKTHLNKDVSINAKSEYIALWNRFREMRRSDYRDLIGVIRSIINVSQIENLTAQFSQYESYLKVKWLPTLDKGRIDDILYNVSYSLVSYLSQDNFDDKEKFKGLIIGRITQLTEEIIEQPTRFSYEGLLPLLRHIEILVNQSFRKVMESSTPIVSISVLGESRFLDEDNNVAVQIGLTNAKGCSPIYDIHIEIIESPDYELIEKPATFSQSLKGGSQQIFTLNLRVKESALKQTATILSLFGSYKTHTNDDAVQVEEQKLSIRFYSHENFVSINNPFAAVADSGPVKDRAMFFGRDLLIEEICNSLTSQKTNKCVIIRGQKRSGKSSLLYHLKEALRKTGNFVCIHFSLGLAEEINSATFYWQILNGISEFVQDCEEEDKPSYVAPKLSELRENSSIIFYEQLRDLLREFEATENWRSKKLLLMIDEFTYIYSAIQRGRMSSEFMKTWKSLLEKGLFSAVLVGQDVMPKFKAKFPNEFGVTEDRRLTYLDPQDAEQLIVKPIWDTENKRSRFIGKAIEKILDYTSSNPYYIQIFCARLVDFMNDFKQIVVTEADIDEVAKSFTEGLQSMAIDKFDNLLNAGDADLEAIPQEDTLNILRQIA
ncbi:MAG: hypothetical protein EDM72_13060, partial [Chlorobiota bacterium]